MKKDHIEVKALLLIGNDAIAIPGLAIIGAASIMGVTVYAANKLTKKICDVISTKIEEQNKKES